ncbi:MAG: hypothetical protein ACJ8HI_21775 [Massilia sp.]|jgi:hypothetical protein
MNQRQKEEQNEQRVREILERFGEDMSATWMVQSQRVIYHQALERIAVKAGITWEQPTFLISQPDCAVIVATGRIPSGTNTNPHMFERVEWSVGEAHIGVNYRVSGKMAAYPFAMAEKRAKDRVILKLIALHGLVYSEEEADDFKASAPPANDRAAVMQEALDTNQSVEGEDGEVSPFNAMKRMIDEKSSVDALFAFMVKPETKAAMADWSDKDYRDVKDYATKRLVALGWKPNKAPR